MEITLLLEFTQRRQLRQWLMENHSSAKEVVKTAVNSFYVKIGVNF